MEKVRMTKRFKDDQVDGCQCMANQISLANFKPTSSSANPSQTNISNNLLSPAKSISTFIFGGQCTENLITEFVGLPGQLYLFLDDAVSLCQAVPADVRL
jgi:hypothetical protein